MVIVFVVGLVMMIVQEDARSKEIRKAESEYQASLALLKASPVDADLKEETLRKGRAYSNLTRNKQGVTMYDEVALMNDINAACARAGVTLPAREESTRTIEERLVHLQQLKERSLVTAQEYEKRRSEILREV